ncbi:MAG TPA: adenylosuccinate lyase [Candidatus Thermoplasmatota archaeon]|nr:adenylosuccinate lyase [Candidatus Thermoplasmatota archaeon]
MDAVSPLEHRYGRAEMKAVWTETARLRYLLEVESALAWAHSELGTIPKLAAARIAKAAASKKVTPERVKAIEAEIKHDLMAVVKALAEQAGDAGRFVHLGATSYDTIDTANSLQFGDGLKQVRTGLRRLLKALLALAKKHRRTPMLGRTHGQAAVPITFGLKMAVYASEVGRHLERLAELEKRVLVGKMSGATGTMAAFRGKGMQVQELVCKRLGLAPVTASTQIVQRDRYVELFSFLANVATSLEKFATEVRTLQRTEIGEVAEGFDAKKQVGSSTMPQKQNPIVSEQVTGLARYARAHLVPVWENAVQWNERDLANSAPERFIHPTVFILVDHSLHQLAKVFETLRVFPARMRENLGRAQGLMMAESLMITLTESGMGRQEAHELSRQAAMKTIAKHGHYRDACLATPAIVKALGKKGVEKALDPRNYVGEVDAIIAKVVAETKAL